MSYSEAAKTLQDDADHNGKGMWQMMPDDQLARLSYEAGFFKARAAVLTLEVEALTASVRELENTLQLQLTEEINEIS